MKFNVSSKAFFSAAQAVSKVICNKNALAILDNFLLTVDAENGMLAIMGSAHLIFYSSTGSFSSRYRINDSILFVVLQVFRVLYHFYQTKYIFTNYICLLLFYTDIGGIGTGSFVAI